MGVSERARKKKKAKARLLAREEEGIKVTFNEKSEASNDNIEHDNDSECIADSLLENNELK